MTTTIEVPLRDRAYDITVGRGLLSRLADHAAIPEAARVAAVVTQSPVARHYAEPVTTALKDAGLDVRRLEVPDGEAAKDLPTLGRLYEMLAEIPLRRNDLIVALGGGVVGDLAGFLAATWNRGVAVLQIPTTLLAQVDAAIGGKTGINLTQGKNLVGAFHQPIAVVTDVDVLATLPERIRIEGLGEIVKYGLIRDPEILRLLEDAPGAAREGDPELLAELVTRSARVKAQVVAADEHEAGERTHLNLGHTYGHAIEALTGYSEILHGEAVAIGTCLAVRLGVRMGLTPAGLIERTETIMERLGLPTRGPHLDREKVWETMGRDKKATDEVRFVLLEDLARPVLTTPDRADVTDAIDEVEVP